MIGTPNETTPVDKNVPEEQEHLGESAPLNFGGYREGSKRATAIWWLAALLQHTVDSGVDEPTLRTTVIPAARHILEGLQ